MKKSSKKNNNRLPRLIVVRAHQNEYLKFQKHAYETRHMPLGTLIKILLSEDVKVHEKQDKIKKIL